MYESHYLWIMYFFIKNEVLIEALKIIHWALKIIHTPITYYILGTYYTMIMITMIINDNF